MSDVIPANNGNTALMSFIERAAKDPEFDGAKKGFGGPETGGKLHDPVVSNILCHLFTLRGHRSCARR